MHLDHHKDAESPSHSTSMMEEAVGKIVDLQETEIDGDISKR